VTQPGSSETQSGSPGPTGESGQKGSSKQDAPSESWRAEYESLDEAGQLPWESVLRDWMARRLPGHGDSKWVTLGAVLLGNFAAGIVFTLLSVARQKIAADIGSTPSILTWAFTGPSLVAAVVAPALGRFGDLRGHKRMLLFSLVGGMVTSVLVALSPNVNTLIFFRSLSAISAAALGPASLALIFRAFEREDRIKALGYWSLVNAGSPVIGVLVGGPIVDRFGWRWMFLGQIPLFIIAAIVAWTSLRETPRREVSQFDWKGAVTLGAATLCVLLSVNRGPAWGWSDLRILALVALVPLLLILFVWVERREPSPLLPLRLLRVRNVVAGGVAQSLAQFSYLGGSLFLVTDLLVDKQRFGLSLSEASRLSIARPIPFSLVAPLAGYLAIKIGERTTATIGMGCIFAAMVGFTIIEPGKTLWLLVAFIALSGLGMGISNPSLTSTVANAVPESVLGAVGAAQQLVVQMGGVIGTQVLATIAGGDVRTNRGYHIAFAVAAVVAFLSVLSARMIRPMVRTEV
jgi:EmrB/QacA subfamily drug resistance transporter